MLPLGDFDRFKQSLASLPLMADGEKYAKADLISPEFLLFERADLKAYYAPFHAVNPDARVILMGLTPGWTQMEQAFPAARRGLSDGLNGHSLFERIGGVASFSGPMRKNLVNMLDGIGLNDQLLLDSCLDLFGTARHLVHHTSAVSAPIFKRGENYGGYAPALLEVPFLREWVTENFATELAVVPNAIIIPLGRVADIVLQFLQKRAALPFAYRSLDGFPHPSGANGHRQEDFREGKERWAAVVQTWFATNQV